MCHNCLVCELIKADYTCIRKPIVTNSVYNHSEAKKVDITLITLFLQAFGCVPHLQADVQCLLSPLQGQPLPLDSDTRFLEQVLLHWQLLA